MIRTRDWWVGVVAVCLLAGLAAGQGLVVEGHGWLVRAGESGARVVHLPPRGSGVLGASPGSGRLVMRLPEAPEFVASGGSSVYMLSAVRNETRAVLQVEAVASRAGWSYEPSGRARSLATLPGSETVGGFAATRDGPVVALRDAAGLWSMRRWGRSGWDEVGLPWVDGSAGEVPRSLQLAASDAAVFVLGLFGASGDRSVLWSLEAGGDTWRRVGVFEPAVVCDELVCVGAEPMAVTREAGVTVLSALRPPWVDGVIRVEGFESAPMLAPVGDHVFAMRLLEQRTVLDEGTLVAEYTGLGRELYRGALRQQGLVSGNEIRMYALFMSISVALIAVTIFRPEQSKAAVLPEGLVLAGLAARAGGMLIDGLVALVGAGVVLSVVGPGGEGGAPGSSAWLFPLTTLLAVAHTTLGEWGAGASVGKLLMGCRVVTVDGRRLPLEKALVRNLIRWAVFPLVLFAFGGESGRRHPGDLAAGSVVVRRPRG